MIAKTVLFEACLHPVARTRPQVTISLTLRHYGNHLTETYSSFFFCCVYPFRRVSGRVCLTLPPGGAALAP